MRLKKRGNDLAMLIEFTAPDRKMVSFSGQKAQIFYPKINTVQEYDLGKQRDLVNQFLLLGFGTSGKELSRNYNVKLAGQETVSGKSTARLELTPKNKKVAEQVRRIELWVDTATGQPMRQKFWQSAGDYTQVEYSNLKLNPGMADSEVALNLPAGVKREYPQK
jgi:outer membrane lipoprotein-sorting protein